MKGILEYGKQGWVVKWSDPEARPDAAHWEYIPLYPYEVCTTKQVDDQTIELRLGGDSVYISGEVVEFRMLNDFGEDYMIESVALLKKKVKRRESVVEWLQKAMQPHLSHEQRMQFEGLYQQAKQMEAQHMVEYHGWMLRNDIQENAELFFHFGDLDMVSLFFENNGVDV